MRIAASRPRIAVECCVWLLLVALTLETWLVAGIAAPCRVVGGSMAETLLGEHRNAVCADCGRAFAIGVDQAASPPRAICPNCGYAAGDFSASVDLPGDRLLVDRVVFSFRSPRRWEIVALRHPQHADVMLVKRVVGLPGETVEIRNGDVFINGKILRKNLTEQHALAVLVHDANCQPTQKPAPPPRWRAARAELEKDIKTAWRQIDGVFSHETDAKAATVDWLAYHHERRLPDRSTAGATAGLPSSASERPGENTAGQASSGTQNPTETPAAIAGVCPTPVTDVGGYNQSRPRREEDVYVVRDLLLSLRLAQISGSGAFCIRASDGGDTFEARLQFDGENPWRFRWQIRRNGQKIADSIEPCTISAAAAKHGLTVEASLVDRQFLLAAEGQTLSAIPYERTSDMGATAGLPSSAREHIPENTAGQASSATHARQAGSDAHAEILRCSQNDKSAPLAVGVERLGATVRELRVYRDVYYTPAVAGMAKKNRLSDYYSTTLREGEYFVLGDNSVISDDSRTFAGRGTIDSNLLIGKPLTAISTVETSYWHFQVPNFPGIRYIR